MGTMEHKGPSMGKVTLALIVWLAVGLAINPTTTPDNWLPGFVLLVLPAALLFLEFSVLFWLILWGMFSGH